MDNLKTTGILTDGNYKILKLLYFTNLTTLITLFYRIKKRKIFLLICKKIITYKQKKIKIYIIIGCCGCTVV